jgi:hypothetical protein
VQIPGRFRRAYDVVPPLWTMDGGSFLSFPYRYVCPEPVLVKMKTIVFKWRKKDVVLRTWTIEVGMWRILSTLSRIHVSHSKNPPCTK